MNNSSTKDRFAELKANRYAELKAESQKLKANSKYHTEPRRGDITQPWVLTHGTVTYNTEPRRGEITQMLC